jgi:hypothetical protein
MHEGEWRGNNNILILQQFKLFFNRYKTCHDCKGGKWKKEKDMVKRLAT